MSLALSRLPLLSCLLLGLALSPVVHAAAEWKPGIPRTAYVTMFEWSWDAIARECTNFLGPKGYAAVQVSPPQEHIGGGAWWTRYQPLSYQIQSRSGNRAQFQAMVSTCKTAGVDVYADAVINHMAAVGENFSVPYSSADFHHGCTIQQSDYGNPGNRSNVTQCSLVGLPDLDTGSSSVQGKIAAYLRDLRSLGVAGFRVDAAKHIRPAELAAIKALVPGDYFFTQEVIRDGNVAPELPDYAALGTINEFNFAAVMKNAFLNRGASISTLNTTVVPGSAFLPSNQATIFVHNHDTERKECSSYSVGGVCDSMNTFNGDKLYLADVFMLAWNYGYPTVASGYYFDNHDMGPPASQPYSGSETVPANCSSSIQMGKWDCIHRDRRVANMVGFRNYSHGAAVSNWVIGDSNQIAFSRTGKGFVAINNSATAWQKTFTTGLADGNYCNVLASDQPEFGVCPGSSVNVSGGQVTLSIAPASAVALHVGARDDRVLLPPAPTPVVSQVTPTSARLTWTASSDVPVAGYKIYVDGVQRGTTTATSFIVSGLTPGVRHVAALRVFDAAGNMSSTGTGTAFNTLASTMATVYYYSTWSKVYGYSSRYMSLPGMGMASACSNYKVKTFDMAPLSSAKAQFHNGAGSWDPLTYTITPGINIIRGGVLTKGSDPCDTIAPSVPTNLVLGSLTGSAVTLSWAASTDNTAVAGYRIYRNATLLGSSTTATYTDTTVTANATYSYTIRAFDAAGNESGVSDPIVLNPQAQALVISFKVTATTASNESIYITGNRAELGNWSTTADAARRCSAGSASVWTCTVSLPLGTSGSIEYKYQKLGAGVVWESGANRSYTLPAVSSSRDDGTFRQ